MGGRSLVARVGQRRHNEQVDIYWSGWLAGLAIAGGVWITLCAVMVALARRLPPGLLLDLAEFLPACVTTVRRLRRSPHVPRRAKVALLIALVWVLSPIDLLPEFLPVIGPLDDVVAVVLLLRYAARSIPRDQLMAAWPAEPHLLVRVLDGRRTDAGAGSPRPSRARFSRRR